VRALRALSCCLILGGAFAAMPGAAFAAGCSQYLSNDAGTWEIQSNGSISDVGGDAYDSSGRLTVGQGAPAVYAPTDPSACTTEDGDREIAYPVETIDGLEVSRKLYVPGVGSSFARWLDIVRNPGAAPVTATLTYNVNLGSDASTVITATSSGDNVFEVGDSWYTNDEDPSADSKVAGLLDGAPTGRADAFDAAGGPGPGTDGGPIDYQNVTIEPGETVVYMHVDGVFESTAKTLAFAQANQSGSAALYSGLSAEERGMLRNWARDPDTDRDGLFDPVDNCPSAANADQADLDRDGTGDACDADADGDGVSDAGEVAIGLNPRSADSDGDGKLDGVDACPKTAGASAEGCPVTTTTVAVARQRSAPSSVTALTTSSKRSAKPFTVTTTGRLTLPAGLTAADACAGGVVAVIIRSSKGKPVSVRRAALLSDCTYSSKVTFRLTRLLSSRLSVAAEFLGNDALSRGESARQQVSVR
jgi:hypothetical protein